MADMLKFRKGTYAQIQAATKVPGTIYIAKDEKAMYVDIDTSENGRIRIGDFIRVNTVEGIKPPYSTSALYYVEADNALLKYDGSAWKQVNGTDDLAESLEALDTRVTTAEGKITSLETKVGKAAEGEAAATGLFKAVADNTANIATNASDIEALKAAVGMNEEGEVEGLASVVADIRKDLTTAEGEIDALQEAVSGHGATIGQHTTDIAKNAEDIAKNAKAISDHEAAAAQTYATKTDLANEKKALQDEIDADVLVETNRATQAEAALSGRVKTLEDAGYQNANQVGSAIDTKIAAARALITTEIDEDVAALKAEVIKDYATKSALEAVDAKVLKNAGDIEAINTNITNNIATKNELTSGVSEAKSYADGVAATAKSEAIADAATKYATLEAIGATNEAVSANAADIEALEKALADHAEQAAKDYATKDELNKEVSDRDAAVKAEAKARGEAISALETAYKAADETLTQAVAKAQGDATKALADAATADGKAVAAQNDINAWKTAHEGDYDNDTIDAKVKTAKDAADEAQDTADANAQSIITLNAAVEKLNGNAEVVGSVDNKVAAAKAELEDKITDKINAANSMTYKKGVGAESELPVTAEAGDTYVANGAFTASFGNVLPGDLIIATGNETDGVIGTKDLSWTLVHTGYDATLEQTIKTVDGKIQLTSAVGNVNNGAVSFVAETGSAAKVTVADNTVTIGMVWEDFD